MSTAYSGAAPAAGAQWAHRNDAITQMAVIRREESITMIMRAAPSDVSRTRHPVGAIGGPGGRMVPAFGIRVTSLAAARDRVATHRVLD